MLSLLSVRSNAPLLDLCVLRIENIDPLGLLLEIRIIRFGGLLEGAGGAFFFGSGFRGTWICHKGRRELIQLHAARGIALVWSRMRIARVYWRRIRSVGHGEM